MIENILYIIYFSGLITFLIIDIVLFTKVPFEERQKYNFFIRALMPGSGFLMYSRYKKSQKSNKNEI